MKGKVRLIIALVAVFSLGVVGAPQIREILKVVGVGAAVKQFGPEINRAFNNIVNHEDTNDNYTKVVPIITIGINSRGAIGAAQVKGTRARVEQVQAVAAPEANFLGDEIKLRAMVPTSSTNITNPSEIEAVDGVGVSGIVDLKL